MTKYALECNRVTDLKFPQWLCLQQYNRPFSTGQFSSFRRETGMLLPRSERKNKKSCNKNAMKNSEMLEKLYKKDKTQVKQTYEVFSYIK
jgi:hypothetical protein